MSNLETSFPKTFTPTEDQRKAISALTDFFNSDKKVFLLKGYAGTGKTFLVRYIVRHLAGEGTKVLMAPTGRASQILQEKTGCLATTIHKAIYNFDDITEVETSKEGNKKKFKFRFNLNHDESDTNKVFIVDESSMVSNKYSEGDFFIFGSGKLLSDLISFVAPQNIDRKNKIVFIGDAAQLPPVTDNISGALSSDYLKDKFNINTSEYELTEVVRQGESSGILDNATYLRDQLLNKARNTFELKTNNSDVVQIETDAVVDCYLEHNPSLSISEAVLINHSNKSALDFNLSVRERLFEDKNLIAKGDILILSQNCYQHEVVLYNGTMVKVTRVNPTPVIKGNLFAYDAEGNECRVSHKYREIEIQVKNDEGEDVLINCLILESFLYSPSPNLTYEESIAQYLEFKMRNDTLKAGTKEFKDSLRSDRFFNALKVKYGYAITCHKAQGGEWKSAIINMDVTQGKLSDNFLRWTYTAVTRASKKLYLFNLENENQFVKFNYNHQLLQTGTQSTPHSGNEITFTLPTDIAQLRNNFNLADEPKFKQDKFIEILAVADSLKIKVTARHVNNYQEIYVFSKGNKIAGLIFYYNGKEKFTRTLINHKYTTDAETAAALLEVFSSSFNITIKESEIEEREEVIVEQNAEFEEANFTGQYSPHKVLFRELKSLLEKSAITIVKIEHGAYFELYQFERGSDSAVIQFYYDGKNRYKNASPMLNKCNSNTLLNELNTLLSQLKNQ